MSLKKLETEIAKLNTKLEGMTDELVDTMDKYQNEYERLLRNKNFDLKNGNLKSTIANYNKAQSMSPMQKLGFNDLALSHVKQYTPLAKEQIIWNKRLGISVDLDFKDLKILRRMQSMDFSLFQMEASLLDERIKRELVNAIALEMPYQQTVSNLSSSLLGAGPKSGSLAGYANTYMRTALFSLTKAVDQEIYDTLGIDEYLYAGPVDAKTREFCIRRVNKVFTREQIEEFGSENGGGLNGFLMPGSYNCRHRMSPLEIVEA